MADIPFDIVADPEANVLYEKCADVDAALWLALAASDAGEITRRTGAICREGTYELPFFHGQMTIDPERRRVVLSGPPRDPEFQLCLVALLYLLRVDPVQLKDQVSPREFKGGTTFFQGPHALPVARLEARFGQDRAALLTAGRRLGGQPQELGDAALILPVFPGLPVGLILWEGDDEFPAQVSLTVPAGLDQFWPLDAVWALLNVIARELLRWAP